MELDVPLRTWGRIGVAFVGAVLSSSLLQSFPTFEPILLDRRPARGAGLFSELCNSTGPSLPLNDTRLDACQPQLDEATQLYSISLGLSVATSLLTGWLYDVMGPRASVVLGALLTSAGLASLTLGLGDPGGNWLVWAGSSFADCAGSMVSMAMFGFIWHVPRHQAMLTALVASATGLSSYMAVAANWLVSLGMRPRNVWLVFAAGALLSAGILALSAVSRAELHERATAITGVSSKSTAASVPAAVRDVLRVWRGSSPAVLWLFFAYTCATYVMFGSWSANYVSLLNALLPKGDDAARLVAAFALVSGLLGALTQPLLTGYLFDRIGIRLFLLVTNLGMLALLTLMPIPSYAAQLAALVLGVQTTYAWAVCVMNWAVAIVPPSLVGTCVGLMFAAAGLLQMAAVACQDQVARALGARTKLQTIIRPIMLYGSVALLLGAAVSAATARRMPLRPDSAKPGGAINAEGEPDDGCLGAGRLDQALLGEPAGS
jgi:hypothetical protein